MAALAPAALALQVVGGVVGGVEQDRAARAGARVDEENARLALLEAEQQADATRTEERRQAGEMITVMGGSGVQLGSGSAADVLAQSAYQRELEVLNIRRRATREARGLQQAADDKRKAGKAAIIGGLFGAAATALQGVSNIRAQRAAAASAGRGRAAAWGSGGRAPRPTIAGVAR
jgi:hypothetical protein